MLAPPLATGGAAPAAGGTAPAAETAAPAKKEVSKVEEDYEIGLEVIFPNTGQNRLTTLYKPGLQELKLGRHS